MAIKGSFHGTQHNPMSLEHLAKFTGGPLGWMSTYLYPFAVQDVQYLVDDFLGPASAAVDAQKWITNAGTGATAFAVPATPILGGAIRGITGTDATQSNRDVNLYGGSIWRGDSYAGIEVKFRASIVTNLVFEIGFIDAMTTITTPKPAVTDIDGSSATTATIGNGVGDAALVAMDVGQTLTTMALCGLGSGALNSGVKALISTLSPTLNTWMTVRVQLDGNTIVAIINNDSAYRVSIASGIEGGTLLMPYVYANTTTTGDCNFDLGHIRVWQG